MTLQDRFGKDFKFFGAERATIDLNDYHPVCNICGESGILEQRVFDDGKVGWVHLACEAKVVTFPVQVLGAILSGAKRGGTTITETEECQHPVTGEGQHLPPFYRRCNA